MMPGASCPLHTPGAQCLRQEGRVLKTNQEGREAGREERRKNYCAAQASHKLTNDPPTNDPPASAS